MMQLPITSNLRYSFKYCKKEVKTILTLKRHIECAKLIYVSGVSGEIRNCSNTEFELQNFFSHHLLNKHFP